MTFPTPRFQPSRFVRSVVAACVVVLAGPFIAAADEPSVATPAVEQAPFNPAFGDDIWHTHPAGMWMVNWKFNRNAQKGLRAGTSDVSADDATPVGHEPFGYMMVPTRMTMDMSMVMVMYGVTDRLTLMAMGSWMSTDMEVVMNEGDGPMRDRPMKTSGMGDSELRAIVRAGDSVTASLGVGLPTGSTDRTITAMDTRFRAPYDMQGGSGTTDLRPALTYLAAGDGGWTWGGQASGTIALGDNSHGWHFGNSAKINGWLERSFAPAAAWLRLTASNTSRIHGHDPKIDELLDPDMGVPMPDADPRNYGGRRIDAFVGGSFEMGPFSFGLEAGVPLYQKLNGLQSKNRWSVTAGIQAMF